MKENFFTRNSDTFEGVKKLVELIGIPIAVVVFLWNYIEHLNTERVASSNQLVAQFFGTDVVKAKIAFEQEFANVDRTRTLADAARKAVEDGDICSYHAQTRDLVAKVGLDQYLRLDSFFNSVAVCVESGGCDKDTICSAMLDDVDSFRNAFCSIGDERAQSLNKPVASHYEVILRHCGGDVSPSFCDVVREKNPDRFLDYSKC